LGKNVVDKKRSNKDQAPQDDAQGSIKDGHDILYILFDLMTLALCHAYLLKQ